MPSGRIPLGIRPLHFRSANSAPRISPQNQQGPCIRVRPGRRGTGVPEYHSGSGSGLPAEKTAKRGWALAPEGIPRAPPFSRLHREKGGIACKFISTRNRHPERPRRRQRTCGCSSSAALLQSSASASCSRKSNGISRPPAKAQANSRACQQKRPQPGPFRWLAEP